MSPRVPLGAQREQTHAFPCRCNCCTALKTLLDRRTYLVGCTTPRKPFGTFNRNLRHKTKGAIYISSTALFQSKRECSSTGQERAKLRRVRSVRNLGSSRSLTPIKKNISSPWYTKQNTRYLAVSPARTLGTCEGPRGMEYFAADITIDVELQK